jgi:hypothetical protein
MSQPAVKVSDIKRYFNRNPNYLIEYEGGDMFIKQLPTSATTGNRGKRIVRIGHQFANYLGAEMPRGLIKKIERDFGVTRQDLLNN